MSGMINHLFNRKVLTPEQESAICQKCQFCCRWHSYRAPFKGTPAEHVEFMNEWGFPTAIEPDSLGEVIRFYAPIPCQHITDAGCAIYEKRPVICRNHRGGDSDSATIPYCGWYEYVGDDAKFRIMKGEQTSEMQSKPNGGPTVPDRQGNPSSP